MRTTGSIVIIAALAAGVVSCSSPGTPASTGSTTAAGPTAAAGTAAPAAADLKACTADDVTVGGAPGSKPTITVPATCSPPKKLLTKDLVVGTGPEVTEGADMQAHYDLVAWSDGQELDSSWGRGQPFPLKDVGHAQVIDGWNEGLIGMKQGGRRLLVVPPDKGYGSGGGGPVKPGETLLFVVDAVQVGS
jgi:peptidylprolyl isomerase